MSKKAIVSCKECGRKFTFSQKAFSRQAEYGRSRMERCPKCRRKRRHQARYKTPYFHWRQRSSVSHFFRGVNLGTLRPGRKITERELKPDSTGMKIGITDKDIIGLYRKLEENKVVILVSATGTGKSTIVPFRLLEPPETYAGDFPQCLVRQGQIAMTEPLTAATDRIPRTIAAKLLGSRVGPGQEIGLRHGDASGKRRGDLYDDWNLLVVVTDGSLRNWIRDGRLSRYSVVIIDEAHQRSCNIDTILILLEEELPKYPHLRVIISSATIDAENFRGAFERAGITATVYDLTGRGPVKEEKIWGPHYWGNRESVPDCGCWLCGNEERREEFWRRRGEPPGASNFPREAARFTLDLLQNTEQGSVIVFMPGEGSIKETAGIIQSGCGSAVEVIMVYSLLGDAEVTRRFEQREKPRRVLVTTNIAETSHTLDDLVYVVDTGLVKRNEWNPETLTSDLIAQCHSQDGCQQRWGRVGREQDGYVYCLYSEEQFASFEEHTPPEVMLSCLDDVLLNLKAKGICTVGEIGWVSAPAEKEMIRSGEALQAMGLVDEQADLREEGLELYRVARKPEEIALMQAAERSGCLSEAITLLSYLADSEGRPRTGQRLGDRDSGLLCWDPAWDAETKRRVNAIQQSLKVGCQDDLAFVIKLASLYNAFRDPEQARCWARRFFINIRVLEECRLLRDQLLEKFRAKAEERPMRDLRLENLGILRILLARVWPGRRAAIVEQGGDVYCCFADYLLKISPNCAGDWPVGSQPYVLAAAEELVSFLVSSPEEQRADFRTTMWLDQKLPVGTPLTVAGYNAVRITGVPEPIKIGYRPCLDQQASYWQVSYPPGCVVQFPDAYRPEPDSYIDDFDYEGELFQGAEGELRLWKNAGETVVADIADIPKRDFAGDKTTVVVTRVINEDLAQRAGWVEVSYDRGESFAVDFSQLELSGAGYGLDYLIGKQVEVDVWPDENNVKTISAIPGIIADLDCWHERLAAGEPEIVLKGLAVAVKERQKMLIVAMISTDHRVFSWEIPASRIAGRLRDIVIGEEVIVGLSLKEEQSDYLEADLFLESERHNLPPGFRHDSGRSRLYFPFALGRDEMANWKARPGVKDLVWRHSWRYCFAVEVKAFSAHRENLEVGSEEYGTVSSVNLKKETVQIVLGRGVRGFAYFSDLPEDAREEGYNGQFIIIKLNQEDGFLRLGDRMVIEEREKAGE